MLSRLINSINYLFIEEHWSIGVAPVTSILEAIAGNGFKTEDVVWIDGPRNCFLADPCWLDEDQGIFLCEVYFYRNRRGRIAVAQIVKKEVRLVSVLEIDSKHLSFPQLYRTAEGTFLVPESALDEAVRAFAFDTTTFKIIADYKLIEGRRLVDPVIWHANGVWWLVANDLARPDRDVSVFRSDRFLGPWKFFCKKEAENSRSAGQMLFADDNCFWPTQFNTMTYGGGIVLRRVDCLDAAGIASTEIGTLKPLAEGPYPDGLHSLSVGEHTCLVDGKRSTFRPLKAIDVLISRFRQNIEDVRGI